MNIKPTVGRIVYYKSRGSLDLKFPPTNRAAIVTDVREALEPTTGTVLLDQYQVRVCVFNPEGLFFSDWLYQGQNGGDWDWMPFQKDQAARTAPGIGVGTLPPEK